MAAPLFGIRAALSFARLSSVPRRAKNRPTADLRALEIAHDADLKKQVPPDRKDLPASAHPLPAAGALRSYSTGGDWVDCGLYVPHLAVTLGKAGTAVNPVSHIRPRQPWHLRGVDLFTVRDGRVAAKLPYVKG